MAKARRNGHLRVLSHIDGILGSSHSLHTVIRRIYKEIGRVFDTRNFYIALYHAHDDSVSFEIYYAEGIEIKQPPRKLSHGLTEHIIRTKRPLRINRNLNEACRRINIKPFVSGRNAKSWLGVPMIYKGNIEGVINVQNLDHEDAYSATDELFLLSIASRAAIVVANTRLIDDEIRRAKELNLMNRIAHRLTRSLNVNDICDSVAKLILQNFKKYVTAIFIVDKDIMELKKLSAGFKSDVPRHMKIKPGQGIVGTVWKRASTLVANDVRKEPNYVAFGQTSTKSEIAIPLTIARKTIGVIDIQCNELNAFNPGSVRVLELIADRLSVALHNARLYEQATEHARELAVSFNIARSLISALQLDDVLQRIIDGIRDDLGHAHCTILLIDENKKDLYVKAAHGYPRRLLSTRLSVKRKQGITAHVAATGRPFYAPDVAQVPFYSRWKKTIRSEAAVPLMIKDKVIGVLDVESEELDAFSDKDLKTFTIIASQAAIAIENARLFDETKSLSLTDGLTMIANRRHFDLIIENEIRKARSYSRPISLAMIDLDDFKHFNDRFGHPAGDRMLTHVAQTIKKHIRETDFLARYGGEEFILILPETNNQTSLRVLDRIRGTIASSTLELKNVGRRHITVSVGLATYPQNGLAAAELLESADRALYRAKSLGKNRVETA